MILRFAFSAVFVLAVGTGCSDSSGTETAPVTATPTPTPGSLPGSSLQIDSIGKVVGVTDPVVSYAATDTSSGAKEAATFNSLVLSLNTSSLTAAAVSLGDSASSINTAFNTASGSKAYCETVNNAMKFFKEASSPDFDLCVLKVAAKGQTLKSGYQTWDFVATMNGMKMTYRMKFALETDSAGGLKKFESFTCTNFNGGSLSQSGYSLETVADSKLTIHARVHSAMYGVDIRTDVSGALNSSGRPVGLKKIDYAEAQSGRSVHTKVVQSAGIIQAIGYELSQNRLTQYLSFSELLDSNESSGQYYITKLGYGDGAALTRITETAAGTAADYQSGWDGATLKADSTEPRIGKVKGRQAEFITSVGDSLDLSFATSEKYDCSGTADATITGSAKDMQTCMKAFDIDQNGSSLCSSLSY